MTIPDFAANFAELDWPIPTDAVSTKAIKSEHGLAVFFTIHKDTTLPPHAHKGQWGTVLKGSIELTISDVTKTYLPGDSYSIPSGAVHSAVIPAGTVVMDIFEEPDRYPVKAQ